VPPPDFELLALVLTGLRTNFALHAMAESARAHLCSRQPCGNIWVEMADQPDHMRADWQ
jgi:hypothetical protein